MSGFWRGFDQELWALAVGLLVLVPLFAVEVETFFAKGSLSNARGRLRTWPSASGPRLAAFGVLPDSACSFVTELEVIESITRPAQRSMSMGTSHGTLG